MTAVPLDLAKIRKAFRAKRYRIRYHARQRAIERQISTADIAAVILRGEIIEHYPKAKPYPKYLMMAKIRTEPLYVALASDTHRDYIHISTVHGFDPTKWLDPWTRRSRS